MNYSEAYNTFFWVVFKKVFDDYQDKLFEKIYCVLSKKYISSDIPFEPDDLYSIARKEFDMRLNAIYRSDDLAFKKGLRFYNNSFEIDYNLMLDKTLTKFYQSDEVWQSEKKDDVLEKKFQSLLEKMIYNRIHKFESSKGLYKLCKAVMFTEIRKELTQNINYNEDSEALSNFKEELKLQLKRLKCKTHVTKDMRKDIVRWKIRSTKKIESHLNKAREKVMNKIHTTAFTEVKKIVRKESTLEMIRRETEIMKEGFLKFKPKCVGSCIMNFDNLQEGSRLTHN